MRIEDVAYLSRKLGNALESSGEHFSNLSESLISDAKRATRITIISGYFGNEYVCKLLEQLTKKRRARCDVRLIFGCDNTTDFVYGKVRERDLENRIIQLGFRKNRVSVKIFRDSKPLHTKLYGFLRTTSPVWYIGSANASHAIEGDRHELMMRVVGKSEALDRYVDALMNLCSSELADDAFLSVELLSYFSAGSLIFKPTRYRRFTHDAFAISSAERRIISDRLGEGASVPYADPNAEGFGFNLLSALELKSGFEEIKAESLRFRKYCVETAFGYWAPHKNASKIEIALKQDSVKGIANFNKIAQSMETFSDDDLLARFEAYRSKTESFFSELGVEAVQKSNPNESFMKFVHTRREWLGRPDWIKRSASKLIVSPMPDIWNDLKAAELFFESFIDDIVAALNAPGRKPLIYKSISKELGLPENPDAAAVRRKLMPLQNASSKLEH